jgi:hypothetical protein
VTGVQTCALPICRRPVKVSRRGALAGGTLRLRACGSALAAAVFLRRPRGYRFVIVYRATHIHGYAHIICSGPRLPGLMVVAYRSGCLTHLHYRPAGPVAWGHGALASHIGRPTYRQTHIGRFLSPHLVFSSRWHIQQPELGSDHPRTPGCRR